MDTVKPFEAQLAEQYSYLSGYAVSELSADERGALAAVATLAEKWDDPALALRSFASVCVAVAEASDAAVREAIAKAHAAH